MTQSIAFQDLSSMFRLLGEELDAFGDAVIDASNAAIEAYDRQMASWQEMNPVGRFDQVNWKDEGF